MNISKKEFKKIEEEMRIQNSKRIIKLIKIIKENYSQHQNKKGCRCEICQLKHLLF